jgi:hypothetical protein
VFLGANVMTGVVNMSMQTIYASKMKALSVLTVYCIAFSLLPWLLEFVLKRNEKRVRHIATSA